MNKLSAVIITFNEEKSIEDCLRSVQWVDEMLVVDSFSKDDTVARAKRIGAKVIQNKWQGHIEQKNFAVSQTSNEWILSLDADERVGDNLKDEIQRYFDKKDKINVAGFRFKRKSIFIGRVIRYCGWYPDYKIRIFNKNNGKWTGQNPHDRIEVMGKIKKFKNELIHYSYNSLQEYINKFNSYTSIAAMEKIKLGKITNLFDNTGRPFFAFLKQFLIKQGYKDGMHGLIICIFSSFYVFIKYVKVRELELKYPGTLNES